MSLRHTLIRVASQAFMSNAEYEAERKAQFDFAPTNYIDWPMATFSPNLIDAARLGELGGNSYSHLYRSQPAVFTVVEFLAWQISQIGLKVYRHEGDEKVPLQDSPLTYLLGYPADGLTYEHLMHATVADLCVYGNAYWVKVQSGEDRALMPVRPFMVEPRGGNLIGPATYRISGSSGYQDFDAEKVVHFRAYNPDDLRIGVSPLEPLRSILREEAEASRDRVAFWLNKARIGGVLKTPDKLSDEAYERLAASFDEKYTGSRHSHTTAILEEGLDFKETAFSPKDAEFIAGRKLTLETVARAYNIPLSVLSLTETSTYASQKEFHKSLYQDTLGPWLKTLEGDIKRSLVPWFTDDTDVFVEFNIAEKLKGSFEEQTDSLRSWVGVPPMSVNEWRARFNLPKLEGDEFDLPVMPQNVLYGGAGGNGNPELPEETEAPEAASSVVPITRQGA